MGYERHVKLFKNGRSQAVRIPREFELPGTEATIWKEGSRLILEPRKRPSLVEWLRTAEPIDDEIGDIPDLPAEHVEL